MRMAHVLTLAGLTLGGLAAGPAQAASIYFSDGFETQTDPLGNPPVGVRYSDLGSGDNYALATNSAAAGTKSLKIIRNASTDNPSLFGVGMSGGLMPGNVIAYTFRVNTLTDDGAYSGTSHNWNNPIQFHVGFTSGQMLLTFGTSNAITERYYGTNNGSTIADSGVTVPRNTAAYDTIRLVLTLTETSPGMLGGTYDAYIGIDGAALPTTPQLNDLALTPRAIPASESTRPAFRIARGGNTSAVYYDDITISQVPEPSALALGVVASGLMASRRRRRA